MTRPRTEVNRSYHWKNFIFICYFYAQEIDLVGFLQQLLGFLNELRCHFEGIAEESGREMDWLEDSPTQPIVTIIIKERGSWKTTVPCKFPTVLGHVLTVVPSHLDNNRMRRLISWGKSRWYAIINVLSFWEYHPGFPRNVALCKQNNIGNIYGSNQFE